MDLFWNHTGSEKPRAGPVFFSRRVQTHHSFDGHTLAASSVLQLEQVTLNCKFLAVLEVDGRLIPSLRTSSVMSL